MKKGNKKVDQIDAEGKLVLNYDTSLSSKELYDRIYNYFPGITKDNEGMIVGNFDGKKYSIRAKNITYLGHPHPIFKKRIQISNDLSDFYHRSLKKGYKPILLGVYTYEDNHVFCGFRIEDYVTKKAHNSSAHVYAEDIAIATLDKFFQKIDAFKNKITVFNPEGIDTFLDDLFESKLQEHSKAGKSKVEKQELNDSTINKIKEFFLNEKKEWNGIKCYQEMIAEDYRNKYQPEWAGFYLEFSFEKYIKKNSLERFIKYAQNKAKGGIDLDLFFPEIEQYGDLKAHSDYSNAIQGNDWATIEKLILAGKHIYYIVCEHSTEKDSEYEYEVTKFWNNAQNKEKELSYKTRMKHSVTLKKVFILDINKNNYQYLSKFKQGINSDGKPREPKIMIDMKNIEHFIIKEIPL